MTRSMFGWSYPPGCLGGPYDDAVDPSALQEAVLGLLEEAEIDTDTNDKIMALIEAAEVKKASWEHERECEPNESGFTIQPIEPA